MTGVCAAVVDIGATWMSDLKEGVCLDAFWLNREHCCWAANDTSFDNERCLQVTSCLFTVTLEPLCLLLDAQLTGQTELHLVFMLILIYVVFGSSS